MGGPYLRLLDRPRVVAAYPSDGRSWHPAQGRGARLVLYVSGEADNRLVFARAWRRSEMVRLLVAVGGRAGLQAAVERRPRLVVVEARPADVDGESLVGALRRRAVASTTPIVVVGHDGTSAERARFIWSGATAVLAPPLDVEKISRSLGMLLETAAWR